MANRMQIIVIEVSFCLILLHFIALCCIGEQILNIMATMNITAHIENQKYFEIWFWLMIATITLICIVGILGNGLVIYVAYQKLKPGALRHLNKVVRNLAITDFLFNILAAPGIMMYWIISWMSGKTYLNSHKNIYYIETLNA